MRMSCNGCRVLRKGCSDTCSIRPCLQWIKSPESQAHATVFLAKFYGRAGLIDLINAGSDHLRPAIFQSLLYEACGRIVNPIYGSVGLLWSGNWQLCQSAVEAVLKGAPITQLSLETAAITPVPPLKAYDIRHVSRDHPESQPGAELHRLHKTRTRFKRSGAKRVVPEIEPDSDRSSGCHVSEHGESMASVETVEASHVSHGEPEPTEESEVELDLTLGFEHAGRVSRPLSAEPETRCAWGDDGDACHVSLGLELSA